MSDEEPRGGVPKSPLHSEMATVPRFQESEGVFGALSSYARRKAAERYARELNAYREAIEAGSDLNRAKERFIETLVRISGDNLDKIAAAEDARVEAELAELELRRDIAHKKQDQFAKQATIEDLTLDAQIEEAELRLAKAREAKDKLNDSGRSSTDRRREIELEIEEIEDKLEALETEYEAKAAADELTDAYKNAHNRRLNRLNERLDRLMAEESKL